MLTRLRSTWIVFLTFTLLFSCVPVSADALDRHLIIELQTRGTSANQEFVEIYNDSVEPLALLDFRLQYKSATGTSWSTKYIFGDIRIAPRSRLLLSSTAYLETETTLHFAAGFSDEGGHVRLVSGDGDLLIVHDLVGWGTADSPETTAANALITEKSLRRLVDEDGHFVDVGNNATDFVLDETPTPEHDELYVVPEIPTEEPEEEPASDTVPVTSPDPGLAETIEPDDSEERLSPTLPELPILVNELFPNPASPLTDAADEFVELFNPNDEPIDISGYQIRTGSTFSHTYVFPENSEILAGQYLVVTSGDTSITLANSTGNARLLGADGLIMSEAEAYEEAPEGQTWARRSDGTWAWTTTPTAFAVNEFTVPAVIQPKVAQPKAATAKKATTKVPKTTAKKASAAKKAPKTTTPKTLAATDQPDSFEEEPVVRSANRNVLAGVGGLALLYAGYEYRKDLQNRFHRARRNRNGGGTSGR